VTVDEGVAGLASGRPGAVARRRRIRASLTTGAVWVVGCTAVALAQPGSDRKLTAAVSAAAAIAVILIVRRLTADPARRYFRSVVGAMVTVSLFSGWLLRRLGTVTASASFGAAGVVERIALPLLVVLLAPLVVDALPRELTRPRELWARRAALGRAARPLDWIMVAYPTVVAMPALLVGIAHHDRLLYVAQDLGLIVFFVFVYVAGRAVDPGTARARSDELVGVLLVLAAAQFVLLGWLPAPLYSYIEAACAGALAVALLHPRRAPLLPVGLAVTLLGADVASILNSRQTQASVAIELYGAFALLAYLAVALRRPVPRWLVVGVTVVALIVFVGFTTDGAALRGQYHGRDESNVGRTYEAHQVRAAIRHSPVSIVFGRGLGSTIDETGAPPIFKSALRSGGRDLAHVQSIHLLAYSFLLKTGFLGLAWLAAFAVALAILVYRTLEQTVRGRESSLVVYAALPLLGFLQAQGATSHLLANPLNSVALGILVTCLAAPAAARRAGSDRPTS
jgi:hypothetical protein